MGTDSLLQCSGPAIVLRSAAGAQAETAAKVAAAANTASLATLPMGRHHRAPQIARQGPDMERPPSRKFPGWTKPRGSGAG